MGSTIHRYSASAADSMPNSSPTTAWSVTAATRSRIARSAASSASLTGVRSGLVLTRRSRARNRPIVIWSARSARSWARSRRAAVSTGPEHMRAPFGADVTGMSGEPGMVGTVVRDDVLTRVSARVAELVSPSDPPGADAFVRVFYEHLDESDFAAHTVDALAIAALEQWRQG